MCPAADVCGASGSAICGWQTGSGRFGRDDRQCCFTGGVTLNGSTSIPSLGHRQSQADAPPADRVYWGLRLSTWLQIAILALAMVALFWPNLRRLWAKTNPIYGEPNWGHSVIVPIIGLYYLYINREALLKAVVRPVLPGKPSSLRLKSIGAFVLAGAGLWLMSSAMPGLLGGLGRHLGSLAIALVIWAALALVLDWGLASILFGMLGYAYGIYPGQNDFIKDLGMVITLFGVVLTLGGWGVMKIAWFPIAFLVCAIPWPDQVYSWVAGPLQKLAAEVAVGVLNLTGVLADREGTKIAIGFGPDGRVLNVAEACAGLRSLMTFISVAAAMAFLSSRPLWQKLVITFSAVPIAIFCNVMRVAGQGLLDTYVSRELSENFAHQFVGVIMLIPAFFLILLVGWLLDRIFIEELSDKSELTADRSQAGTEQALVIEVPRRGPTAIPAPPPPARRSQT